MNGFQINKIKIAFFVFFLFFILPSVQAQEHFRVMFYNVENLFDIKNNPATNDDDLTPEGQLHWTKYRYWKKLNAVGAVINDVGGGYPPALVGLCEVETDSVLFDLVRRTALKKHKYEYIISHSHDMRGSNVALLYQRDQIKILRRQEYTPVLEADIPRTTRNILHVVGKVVSGDTLDVFVCHFPSRVEGLKKTTPYRVQCATLLRQKVDSIFRVRRKANIIIMGDFNDYPHDKSMKDVLDARSLKSFISSKQLYNMFYDRVGEPMGGGYKHRGKWGFLDQFIVSGNLCDAKNRIRIKGKTATVFSVGYMLEKDIKYGGEKPLRTYQGFRYLGGASDHLPIYMDIIIR